MKNKDSYCFLWSVIAALYPAEDNVCKTSSYPRILGSKLKYNDIKFPTTIRDITKFEKVNDLSMNLYGLKFDEYNKKQEIVPIHISHEKSEKPIIHVLMIENTEFDSDTKVYHFSSIRNLSLLVKTQVTQSKCGTYFCDRRLCHFDSGKSVEKHKVACKSLNNCTLILSPEEYNILKFKNYKYKERIQFAVYADIEFLLEPVTNNRGNAYQKHTSIPTNVAYYTKCSFDDSQAEPQVYREKDCITWLVNELKSLAEKVDFCLKRPVPMEPLTLKQEHDFQDSKVCHIYEKDFNEDDVKHRGHCHFTGKYRRPARDSCNINYQDSRIILIVFHNSSGYDSHFFIKDLATSFEGHMLLLSINKGKYISFTENVRNTTVKLRIIDSLRFISSRLSKPASNLNNDEKLITRKYFKNDIEFELLTRKGVFPYNYVDNWQKLDEDCLPAKEKFYSKLNDESISDEDFNHACKVWEKFDLKMLGEYSDSYFKNNVFLKRN